MSPLRSTRSRLASALLIAGLTAPFSLLPLLSAQGQAQAQSQERLYAIAAGPLGAVLSRFAGEAGVVLSFDARLTAGRPRSARLRFSAASKSPTVSTSVPSRSMASRSYLVAVVERGAGISPACGRRARRPGRA